MTTGCGTSAGYQRHRRRGEPACAPCKAAANAKSRAHKRNARAANPEAVARVRKHQDVKYRYGLTPDEYERLKPADGLCPICHKRPATHLDHDHATGQARQLICSFCNSLLGYAEDDPATLRAAADYLEHHASPQENPSQDPIHHPR